METVPEAEKPRMYTRWKEILWPFGGAVLGLLAMPLAIAQYPDFFNDNKYLLPISAVVVALCFIIPFLIHENAKRLLQWAWSFRVFGKIATVAIAILVLAGLCYGFVKLLHFHEKHLLMALHHQDAPPAQPEKRETPPTVAPPVLIPPANTTKHRPKPRITSPVIQVGTPYGNLSARCDGLGKAIISFAAYRVGRRPRYEDQADFKQWLTVNDGLFRHFFYKDIVDIHKELATVHISDPSLDELFQRTDETFAYRNDPANRDECQNKPNWPPCYLSLDDIRTIGERFVLLSTQTPER